MSHRITILNDGWQDLKQLYEEAENMLYSNPNISLIRQRSFIEMIIKYIIRYEEMNIAGNQGLKNNLLIIEPIIPARIIDHMHKIRKYGNQAVHESYNSLERARECLDDLFEIAIWFVVQYGENSIDMQVELLPHEKNLYYEYLIRKISSSNIESNIQKHTPNKIASPNYTGSGLKGTELSQGTELEKDVFETEEEYKERIENLGLRKIGIAKVNTEYSDSNFFWIDAVLDNLSEISICRIDGLYCTNHTSVETKVPYTILGKLKVKECIIYLDINNLFLQVDIEELIPVKCLVLDYIPNESKEDYENRVSNIGEIPFGKIRLVRDGYDISTQRFPMKVAWIDIVNNIVSESSLYISADRHLAKEIYYDQPIYDLYAEFCLFNNVVCFQNLIMKYQGKELSIFGKVSFQLKFAGFTIDWVKQPDTEFLEVSRNVNDKVNYTYTTVLDHFNMISFFSDGLAKVTDNYNEYFIDANGVKVFKVNFDCVSDFFEGRAAVELKEKWGYIDTSGMIVIDCIYDYAADFSDGTARVYKEERWGAIDKGGQIIVEIKYDELGGFSDGLASFILNGKYGYLDKSGNVVLSPRYDFAGDFINGIACIRLEGKYTYIDINGNPIFQTWFDELGIFVNGYCSAKIDGQVGFINKSGEFVAKFSGEDALCYNGMVASIKQDGIWKWVDNNGSLNSCRKYEGLGGFLYGLSPVKINDSWGFLDEKANVVIDTMYEDATPFSEGLALVKIQSKFGYINIDGKYIIPPQFNNGNSFQFGLAEVELDGQWGCIDKEGNIVLPCLFNSVDIISEEFIVVDDDDVMKLLRAVRK